MFPQFGAATADSLSRASSLVLRIGTDAHLYDDPDDVSIAPLLESRFDSEKSEALKRLLALIAQGVDVCNFFPQVVKNVASQSLEVKKLVYLYLLHYAEKRPNEALLSINCFQKDLSDTNPLVRAWALRAMAGIRLHVVAPLVLAATRKCARDPSAYVRKCAAHALPKLFDLLPEENSDLEELVNNFLSDHSHGVVAAAAVAFKSICQNNLLLIAKNFRRLCEVLPDVEEWGQIILIEILLRYVIARNGLVKDSIMFNTDTYKTIQSYRESTGMSQTFDYQSSPTEDVAVNCTLSTLMFKNYIQGQEEYLLLPGCTNGTVPVDVDKTKCMISTSSQNDDVQILLQCTSPLLWSQNSAVVLAAAGVHWIMAPKDKVQRIVKPLLFLLRSSPASKYVVLCNIQVFAKAVPSLFAPYYQDFYVCHSDFYQIRALKLEILSAIATDASISYILEEFQDYIKDPDRRFVADTVAAIGLCAQRLSSVANVCLEGLLSLVSQANGVCQLDGEACILVQAVMSIRAIIKLNPACHEKIIAQLARNLDVVKEPAARSLIIWMLGEYSSIGQIMPKILLTVLKYLAWSFPSEALETKHQILITAVKAILSAPKEEKLMLGQILRYILQLANSDMDYDIRDRARMVKNLTSPSETEGILCMAQHESIRSQFLENIFAGKKLLASLRDAEFRFYLPGSLSHVVLHAAPGYEPLPKPYSLHDSILNGTTNDDDASGSYDSGSSIEESGSYDDSKPSVVSSVESEGSELESDSRDQNYSASPSYNLDGDAKEIPPLHPTNRGVFFGNISKDINGNESESISSDIADLMPREAFESWLDEKSSFSSETKPSESSSARISVNDLRFTVKPKLHMLLDPAIGNGLKVEYTFLSEFPKSSSFLVCVELLFTNCSDEVLTKINVFDGKPNRSSETGMQELEKSEVSPSIIPIEGISSLDPGQKTERVLQVRFHHHLLPLKIAVLCNGTRHLTKLWPDIGYFIRPLFMNVDAFVEKEHQLRGMFECTKSCNFVCHVEDVKQAEQSSSATDMILVVSRSLASKVLSHANVFLVSVDMPVSFSSDDASGLRQRFSSEILSNLKPCLITIVSQGKCHLPLDVSVKINCEDTVFGLNLLNRFAAFLH
ncbi:AP3-complex subunit beta-A [Apostasia shenzhenica]|uniref:AP-3 complex subunit beta n=1 Tax=Apostasia shenzhenica TaxID=1088818 RepID=A0A2I0B2A8_9ASPA|nr:AP3-complex subunit beta-A [Apostasia shenzhenica]